ncbi:MAG: hypothetical protein IT158_06945 [Bryobacterales bacterium]|nr:hypothetical protein [Bryobacterales bacterium]
MNRRQFLQRTGACAAARPALAQARAPRDTAIDFRYSPLSWQTAYCFPDDRHKSLVGERGDLRYGHPGPGRGIDYFPLTVEFALSGMETGHVARQQLEAPGVPIVYTRIDHTEAFFELTTFATHEPGEGRVDNVMVEIRPRSRGLVRAAPLVSIRSRREVVLKGNAAHLESETGPLLMLADMPLTRRSDTGQGIVLSGPVSRAAADQPHRCFLRFPQEGQDLDRLKAGLAEPERLLAGSRRFWREWRPFGGAVDWSLAGRHGEFLMACARNILQAREVRDGRLTFQVGPTVYRGLWVVDGHFILEAARYLGHDAEAQQGLEATWARQDAEGSIFAGGGREHWKDTGIAMFTLVRQAELSRDWNYFRKMTPEVLRAVRYLAGMRDRGKRENSANGRYGILARGFGDGGMGGIRSEFTNTLWVLAGLRAVTEAAGRLRLPEYEDARRFHDELRSACFQAMRAEMRRHPAGFDYLPMLMKEDPQWSAAEEWDRPRPQNAQWALSQAIYPGLVFERNDPVVQGHTALMQAVTQEDIPAETGWLPHEGVWNYNAAFAAHVYLWAGLADRARSTFTGFLNHATPLYCWREEQPLRGSLLNGYVGDMPHNWASAECVLYLRHMLALEDGPALRLLPGIGDSELDAGEPYAATESPTRFGRVSVRLEPLARNGGWRLEFARRQGPAPGSVALPRALGSLALAGLSGAGFRPSGDTIQVAPDAASWSAIWR